MRVIDFQGWLQEQMQQHVLAGGDARDLVFDDQNIYWLLCWLAGETS